MDQSDESAFIADWPQDLITTLDAAAGTPWSAERLGGMSLARVYRVRSAGRPGVIVKRSPRGEEAQFYQLVAPQLRTAGVPIPAATWIAEDRGEHWLVLEELGAPVPSADTMPWAPDARRLHVLASLHRATRHSPPEVPRPTPLPWLEAATETVLALLPPRPSARQALAGMRFACRQLAGDWCWVSGDPSPPNWGERADGSVALFDWELFRPGSPAEDLAPLVPGLAPPEAFRAAAAGYAAAAHAVGLELPWAASNLERQSVAAKAATVVALLCAAREGRGRVPEEYVAGVLDALPAWLDVMDDQYRFTARG